MVAEGVVDLLEMIEIHDAQSERLVVVARRGNGLRKLFLKQRPVGQFRQRIAGRQTLQIPIECLQVRGHVVETLAQLDHLGIAGDVDPLTEGVLVLAQLAQLFGKRAQRVDRGLLQHRERHAHGDKHGDNREHQDEALGLFQLGVERAHVLGHRQIHVDLGVGMRVQRIVHHPMRVRIR